MARSEAHGSFFEPFVALALEIPRVDLGEDPPVSRQVDLDVPTASPIDELPDGGWQTELHREDATSAP